MPSPGQITVPSGLATALQLEVVPLAILVRLDRLDGTSLGFSTSDIDVVYGGLTYEALAAIQGTAITEQIGAGVNSMDITGLLQSDRITEADLRAGLYDGAAITIRAINFTDVASGAAILMAGTIGDVTTEDGQYTAEVRSKSQRLSQSIGELTSKTCRVAALGDARCAPGGTFQSGSTIASFRFNKTLSVVSGDGMTLTFGSDAAATGYYGYGMVKFTSGPNNNIEREVKSHTLSAGSAVLVLQEAFPYLPVVGNTARLEAGCDRVFATCQAKFNNRYNFQGEPYIPPQDLIIQQGKGT